MIRAALTVALAGAAACAGPSSSVPTGFEDRCASGPRVTGVSKMGVTNEGFSTDTDAEVVMTGRIGGGCIGAGYDVDDD